ncbi:histidine--tRNA ligase, partial [Candidatus Desantisbacteria bacterium CG_4_10_14_0_8_um_filter_48_22]
LKAKYTLILGGDELAKGIIMLRDMRSSTQKEIPLADLESELKMLKS